MTPNTFIASLEQSRRTLDTYIQKVSGNAVTPVEGIREFSDDFSAREKRATVLVYQMSDMVAATPFPAQQKALQKFLGSEPVNKYFDKEPIWGGGVLEHLTSRVDPAIQKNILNKFVKITTRFEGDLGELVSMIGDVIEKMEPQARPAAYDGMMRSSALREVLDTSAEDAQIDFKVRLAALLPETDRRMLGYVTLPVSQGDNKETQLTAVCLGSRSRPKIYVVSGQNVSTPSALNNAWERNAWTLLNEENDNAGRNREVPGSRAALLDLFANAARREAETNTAAARALARAAGLNFLNLR